MMYNDDDFCVLCCIDVYAGSVLLVSFVFFVQNPTAVLKLRTR
jgi:hypothetical protein